MNGRFDHRCIGALLLACCVAQSAAAQTSRPAAANGAAGPAAPATAASGVVTPPDYVIGPDDELAIVFWREKEMSSQVTVRPDGMISLPLLNDVPAAGLTPDQLRAKLDEAAAEFIEEPTVTVQVMKINSRKVFVTGNGIAKQGPYQLSGPTTVLQMISTAGGVLEYAKTKQILIMRSVNGKEVAIPFNYDEVRRGRRLQQNILLQPGDTLVVP